jgi:Protein of unknown function (DUF732)
MRLLLMLTSLAAMIGMAVPAHADSADDAFLATVKAAGITFPDPDRAIGAGRWVCKMANQGNQLADIVKTVEAHNPGLTEENAAKFAAIAANTYCPNALPANGVQGGSRS